MRPTTFELRVADVFHGIEFVLGVFHGIELYLGYGLQFFYLIFLGSNHQ